MLDNFRRFQAGPDPFGRTWEVEFRWLQTGISIRHADTVDVKFIVWMAGENGAKLEQAEKIIAMPHPAVLELSRESGHEVTDPWCSRLAAQHLLHCFESAEDIEKTLITAPLPALRKAAGLFQAA
jgi:hypothetical protein